MSTTFDALAIGAYFTVGPNKDVYMKAVIDWPSPLNSYDRVRRTVAVGVKGHGKGICDFAKEGAKCEEITDDIIPSAPETLNDLVVKMLRHALVDGNMNEPHCLAAVQTVLANPEIGEARAQL